MNLSFCLGIILWTSLSSALSICVPCPCAPYSQDLFIPTPTLHLSPSLHTHAAVCSWTVFWCLMYASHSSPHLEHSYLSGICGPYTTHAHTPHSWRKLITFRDTKHQTNWLPYLPFQRIWNQDFFFSTDYSDECSACACNLSGKQPDHCKQFILQTSFLANTDNQLLSGKVCISCCRAILHLSVE